jgi:type VI secretion system protein ImpH
MAGEARQPAPGVIARILTEGAAFSFFQVVRLLEGFCGGASVGGTNPEAEAIRLRPSPDLVFPLAGVARVDESHDTNGRARYLVTTNFLGLYGTTSPLPTSLTEDILMFDGERDRARDLMDVLNHRLLSLYYRAWAKYRYPVQWKPGGTDEISAKLLALCGLADASVRDALGVPAVRVLRYAGVLTQTPRSAAALRGILADYFEGVPCTVQQCVLRWVPVDAEDRWRIGRQNGQLGESATVGARVADRRGKLRIVFGPTDLPTFLRFLPPGDYYAAAAALARFVLRDNLEFDFEVRLRPEEVPPPVLSRNWAPCLGWTSWLGRRDGRDGVIVLRVPAAKGRRPSAAHSSS